MAYKLVDLDKPGHFSLHVDGKFRALVVVSKQGRSNVYRVHLGRMNWTDIVSKPNLAEFVKERWNG